MKKIVIGTRGSILALAQAEKVKELLQKKFDFFLKNDTKKIESIFKENFEKLEIEIKIIVTKGDKNTQDFEKIKSNTQKDLFVKEIEKGGLIISGTSPDGKLVEFVEAPGKKFFIATQAHPEFKSRPITVHPLFVEFVKSLKKS